MALRTDFTNDTLLQDVHPTAHNTTNAAVNALDTLAGLRKGPAGHWIYLQDPRTMAAGGVPSNHLRMMRVSVPVKFDMLQLDVVTAVATATATIAVYATNTDGMPTALAASGSVSCATTGLKSITFTALPPGTYWAGAWVNIDGLQFQSATTSSPSFVSPTTTVPTPTYNRVGWQQFVPGGTLPDPFGPPYPRDANTVTADQVPIFWARIAA
jgi:hypothetical protein